MSLESRPFPGLFGGVSQQPPAMRHPTHCTEQLNGISTTVDGLFKRPGTRLVKVLDLSNGSNSVAGSYGNVYPHIIDKGANGLYQLLIADGNLMLYNLGTGQSEAVSAPNGYAYLRAADPQSSFRCVSVADYTFIVNTTKTTAMRPTTDQAPPRNVAYAVVRAAVPKISYTVVVDNVPYAHYSEDTPTVDSVATGIRGALSRLGAGYSVYRVANTTMVKIIRLDGQPINVSWSADGWPVTTFQVITDGVDRYSDLPPTFEGGVVLAVKGSADTAADPYYVEWRGGRWQETKKPQVLSEFDAVTMPHQLRPVEGGGWRFEPVAWGARKAGDDVTNPVPSFIGRPIRGTFFFRNRLGFLSGDSVVLSRSGEYFSFFGKSGTQVLDTDPIDLSAPTPDVDALDWAIPFNRQLLVWSSTKQQFVLDGGDLLSPETAQLIPTTTFQAYTGASPQSLGNRALFLSNLGQYSQVNLYRVSSDTVTNVADDVTSHCPYFVPGGPRAVAVSTSVRAAVVVPADASKSLYFFKYEMDDSGEALSQKAWSKLTFNTPDQLRFISAHWTRRALYLTSHVVSAQDPDQAGRYVVEVMDMDPTGVDLWAGMALRLDRRALTQWRSFDGEATTVEVPYLADPSLTLLACKAGVEPVELEVLSCVPDPANLRTLYRVRGDTRPGRVWCGQKFPFRYVFTEPQLRDQQGAPVQSAAIKLKSIIVRYVKTGWFKAVVTPFLREAFSYVFVGRNVGQPGQGPNQLALSTGDFSIPVGTNAASTEVAIESDSYLPFNVPYAEWVGDVTLKARR